MKKPVIEITRIAEIEVDEASLDIFKERSAMDQERATLIMMENVQELYDDEEDGLEDDPDLKHFVGQILDELPEDIEYIHFYSMPS